MALNQAAKLSCHGMRWRYLFGAFSTAGGHQAKAAKNGRTPKALRAVSLARRSFAGAARFGVR